MKRLVLLLVLIFVASTAMKSQTVQPPNGLSELQAYSIFYENYKNDEYKGAINYGRWIYKNMPRKLKGYSKFDLEKNLNRLISAYSGYAKNTEDPSLHSAYVDTALMIFDKAMEEFGKDEIDYFEWHLEKGRLYQEHADFVDNAEAKAIEQYRMAYNQDPERAIQAGDGFYVQAITRNLVSQGEKDEALAFIEEVEPKANEKTKEFFDQIRNQLFDSPSERIAFLEGKLENDPQNEGLMNELADLYEQTENMEKAQAMYQKLYERNPNYVNTKQLAEIALNNANYQLAIDYLKEATGMTEKKDELKQIAMDLSNAYMNLENLQQARRYARQAINHDPQWGEPYIQIASIYGQVVTNCTTGRKMEREDKVVYWLVIDYLNKAKEVDPSLSNRVEQQKQSYKPVTPTTEDMFFKGWEEGDTMKVDGSLNSCYSWINETTTARK